MFFSDSWGPQVCRKLTEHLRSCHSKKEPTACVSDPDALCVCSCIPTTVGVEVCVWTERLSVFLRVIEVRVESLGLLYCSPSAFSPDLTVYLSSHWHLWSQRKVGSLSYYIISVPSPVLTQVLWKREGWGGWCLVCNAFHNGVQLKYLHFSLSAGQADS